MIRSQMCQVFFDMFDRARDGSGSLPTTADVLQAASVHAGIMPYMSLRHHQTDDDCRIAIFAPAWQQWLKLARVPRLQSEMMNAEATARKSRVLLEAVQHSCGFHEIGYFSFNDQKRFFVETVSLPARSCDEVTNIFGFAVPLLTDDASSGQPPEPSRQWLNLGRGVPTQGPSSMLPDAA